jgi:glyoxylase-like metal-dependent hydrolase (beta-lactamase superfamily II)
LLLPLLMVALSIGHYGAFLSAQGLGGPAQESSTPGPTRAPDPLKQGVFLAPQAVAAVDISPDGRSIAVATLAFRQDKNFWLLSGDGQVLFGRAIAPWAPFQVAQLPGGRSFGMGLAYSRVTAPFPTVSLFTGEGGDETVLEDSLGERGVLRYGSGDWRTGWLASVLGDLVVRAGDALYTVRGHNGALRVSPEKPPEKDPWISDRPFRMAPSPEGQAMAMGYIVPAPDSPEPRVRGMVGPRSGLVAVRSTRGAAEGWAFSPAEALAPAPPLPDPSSDFPALAGQFGMRPDALVPFRVAASVSAGPLGRTAAVAEYRGWLWVRRGPVTGKWDPPYHVIPFLPRQRGRLRLLEAPGREVAQAEFPSDGLYEVRLGAEGKTVWAIPMSWFSRGLAGRAWLPTDPDRRGLLRWDLSRKGWETVFDFPDAISDAVLDAPGESAWVSCWDGKLSRVRPGARPEVLADLGAPARLSVSPDGSFLVAGTDAGEVVCLEASGKPRWRVALSSTPAPKLDRPAAPVFPDLPIYQVGRTGKEHAYVGDMWLIKGERGGILIDAGGASSIPFTLERIRAAGVDPRDLRHLLHTHSHGDHSGAGYLWRSMGLKVVAPESGSLALGWLMPTQTDYGVWVPRPVDLPLPLKKAGDACEITLEGLRIRAIFVPGHSMDSVIYILDVGGKRAAFTGDLGFQAPSDILHRCWGDLEKAKIVTAIVREQVLPARPDVVFTGHGPHADGTAWLLDLVERSEESIRKSEPK